MKSNLYINESRIKLTQLELDQQASQTLSSLNPLHTGLLG